MILRCQEELVALGGLGFPELAVGVGFGSKGKPRGRSSRRSSAEEQAAARARLQRQRTERVQRQVKKPKKQNAWDGQFAEIMELIANGKEKVALKLAWHWRDNEPSSQLAILGLGEAAEANQDWSLAARAYGSLIDLFPSRADIRRMAGQRLEAVVQHQGAPGLQLVLDTYRQAVEQRPDHPSSHRLYAYALVKAKQFEQAFDAIEVGLIGRYRSGNFPGVTQILREDAELIAAAWLREHPKDRTQIMRKLAEYQLSLPNTPSTRFVLNWETDANDVDFHIYDRHGNQAAYFHRKLASGGKLYADITQGYGPECFSILGKPTAYSYTFQAHYYSMGPMGYGMGKMQVIEHDGEGGLSFQEQPFVIMKNRAYVNLGTLEGSLIPKLENKGSTGD